MDSITLVPISLLIESPTNPRKTFDEGDLQELADNIKANGILQPIVARPVTHSTGFEIVFGHRRFRAAQLADLDQVPVIVRAMTDEHVLIAQLSENMARADVHPIEEADAFDRLIRDHGYTIEQLMEQTGKSRTAVYNRLKLASLTPKARKSCIELGIGAEIATRIARVPAPLQAQAIRRITFRDPFDGSFNIASERQAKVELQRGFTRPLADAVFNPLESYVNCDGPCSRCPKNTDNEPALQDLGAFVCTDIECFEAHEQAHNVEVLERARRNGELLEGDLGALRDVTRRLSDTVRWDPGAKGWVCWEHLLQRARDEDKDVPKVYLYADDGDPIQCLMREDAEALATRFPPDEQPARNQQSAAGSSGASDEGDEDDEEKVQAPARTPAQTKLAENWDAIKAAIVRRITTTQRTGEDLRLILRAQLDLAGELDSAAEAWLGWPDKVKALEESGMHESDARLQMLDALTPDEMAAALLIAAISDLADSHWGGVSDSLLQMRERIAARFHVNVFEPDADLANKMPERDPRVADMFEASTEEVEP